MNDRVRAFAIAETEKSWSGSDRQHGFTALCAKKALTGML